MREAEPSCDRLALASRTFVRATASLHRRKRSLRDTSLKGSRLARTGIIFATVLPALTLGAPQKVTTAATPRSSRKEGSGFHEDRLVSRRDQGLPLCSNQDTEETNAEACSKPGTAHVRRINSSSWRRAGL